MRLKANITEQKISNPNAVFLFVYIYIFLKKSELLNIKDLVPNLKYFIERKF